MLDGWVVVLFGTAWFLYAYGKMPLLNYYKVSKIVNYNN